MLFSSFVFLVLVVITLIVYYIPYFRKYQVQILILSSLVFYAYGQPYLLLLLLLSSFINITASYYVVYIHSAHRKIVAVLGVLFNLFVLLFFKYSSLFSVTFLDTSDSIGNFLIHLPLPIGISFYTFEGISLLVDVYKGNYCKGEDLIPRSYFSHAKRSLFFVSFFPHLIAGPILKAHEFIPQIGVKRLIDIDWHFCFKTLIIGYFLKMVIADNLSLFTFWIAFPYYQSLSSLTLITLLFGYSIQIFADFAGYSLIAIGIAAVFGYRLIDNFMFPYISTSFKEFWKRWHISLSTFLMEYLYFPLGGNRKGRLRTYINLLITMCLGGFWHGAAWSYAVWGLFHGTLLSVERFLKENFKFSFFKVPSFVKILFVFCMVTIGWLLFKLPNFSDVIGFFKAVYENYGAINDHIITEYVFIYSSPVLIYHLHYLLRLERRYVDFTKRISALIYGFMLFCIIANSGISGAFIYFQF